MGGCRNKGVGVMGIWGGTGPQAGITGIWGGVTGMRGITAAPAAWGGAGGADTPHPYLEQMGDHIDVRPHGRQQHTESKAAIDPLQVLLGGG